MIDKIIDNIKDTSMSILPSTSGISSNSINKSPQMHGQFREWTQQHFNRAKFFFNPSHIRQQAQMDRRFLQRINREASNAAVTSFFTLDCLEIQLQKCFQELYNKILRNENNSARAYQLILNSLIYYYSKQTWSTSVPKYVFESLENFLLKDFHRNLEQKTSTIFELELISLLELFILRYSNIEYGTRNDEETSATEDNIYDIFVQIRQRAGHYHLSTFVQNTVINHFGYTMGPLMRAICDRLDLKVRVYKLDPFVGGGSTSGKRKFSLTSLKEEESTPHSSSEDMDVGRKGEEEKEDESSEEDDNEQVRHKKAKITKASIKQPMSLKKAKTVYDEQQNGSKTSIGPQQKKQKKSGGQTKNSAVIGNATKGESPLETSDRIRTGNRQSPKEKSGTGHQKHFIESFKKKNKKMELDNGESSKIHMLFSSTRVASILLSDELLTKYRQRMNAVKRQRNCGGEIFYGRSSMRRGLFERSSNSPPTEETSKSDKLSRKNKSPTSKNSSKQKNRSGRRVISNLVNDDDGRVHIAHTLLNVHNKNPFEAFKLALPKGGSRRLLKQAGKNARKKIERLRRTAAESPAMTKTMIMEGMNKQMEAESNNGIAKEEEIDEVGGS